MELTVQAVDQDGLKPTYAAASAGGDTFKNDGRVMLHVKNGGAGSVTVTVDSIENCNQGFDHNSGGAVPAGEERIFGPFPPQRFNASGEVVVAYSGVTSVTVAALKLPAQV